MGIRFIGHIYQLKDPKSETLSKAYILMMDNYYGNQQRPTSFNSNLFCGIGFLVERYFWFWVCPHEFHQKSVI
jgi:hypothetical protein